MLEFPGVENESAELAFLVKFIKEHQAQELGRQIFVTSFYTRIRFLANYYGAAALFSPEALFQQLPASSKPAVLLVVVRENELSLFSTFLLRPGVKLLSKANDYYFYTYYVEPSGTKR